MGDFKGRRETDARRSRRMIAGARVAIVAMLAVALSLGAVGASAVTTASWAQWTPLAGTAGAYTGSVAIAQTPSLGATYRSDSRGGQVGVITGASTWLAEGTPVGAKYGSSRDRPYLNLRPRADNATGASTTVYTFDRPTPTTGWTFVLGDIDADQVTIRAVGPSGAVLTGEQLGFRGGFNYCAPGVTGRPPCVGIALDVPTWNPATGTLTGNIAAVDTSGSAGWFEPTEPIASLSFTFLRRSGLPVYQTWFASLARDVTGTVTDVATGPTPGVVVRLIDEYGAVVAETTTDTAGAYTFPGVTASAGYTVEAAPPPGKTAVDATGKPADLTTADAVVAFTVRDIIPSAVSGRVLDSDDAPIPAVTVTLTGDGGTFTATSGSDGTFLFDVVPAGTYTTTVTAPDGYSVATSPDPFTIPEGSEAPILGQNFELAANPTLSGRVTAGGEGVAGVAVTVTGANTYSTVTGADGTYSVLRVDPGEYEVTIDAPEPYLPVGAPSRDETIGTEDLADVDFALARPGTISGAVLDGDDVPVPGVTVTVDGPGGPVELTTNEAGEYATDGLPSGDYTVAVTVPDGYEPVGPVSRPVTITDAGDAVNASFTLAVDPVPPTEPPGPVPPTEPPGPVPPIDPPAPPGGGGGPFELSNTGVDGSGPLALGIVLLAAGSAVLIADRLRTRRP